MTDFVAGQIVLADWRGDALPPEPNKVRPAVVVEDHALFATSYPMVILVPLTSDPDMAITALSVTIDPTPENGCRNRCYAVAHFVAATAAGRVRGTPSRVTDEQLAHLRRQIALSIGLG